ncbi:lysophospholipase [Rhodovulum sulfidophilum]|uniref:alpha/beta hydrolase n=2 Tax=Rhodovulum sulfidophilum TaxID=35806 RepID=UPI001924DB7D|nr:alpha/beta fold hydrolase [Rhodovulum sulfidophilum]MBL3574061.1 alpha/beta fold hydrolase [Rhodovulum sulfidophilum]MCF4116091.1 lysophospholipase [Rhodovulum sulfidophilum]
MRLFALLSLFCPTVALAGPVQIEGPAGPLEAEALAAPGARAAVVIVPGSGPVDRDGNAPALGLRSDSYRLLAEALQAAGIASLRIDKRGFGGSAGAIADPNDVTIAAYAGDLRRWVARAAGLAPCVWIAGHSEGGLVALVAAEEPPEALCGLILMATPGRPVGQLLVEQMRALPGNAPLMPEIEAMVATLEAGDRRDPETLPPPLRPLFGAGLQDYMADLFAYDPAAVAERWHGPVLILQGGADMQVRPEDAGLLATAMPQARRVDLPGVTHMLKADLPGRPYATYTDPALPLAPGVVPAILEAVEGR